MTETTTVEKKNTFPKVFIGIIAFLAGVAVGGAAHSRHDAAQR